MKPAGCIIEQVLSLIKAHGDKIVELNTRIQELQCRVSELEQGVADAKWPGRINDR